MTEAESFPPRYYQYLATERRVSNWVKQTQSTELSGRIHRHSSKSTPGTQSLATHSSSLSVHRPSTYRRKSRESGPRPSEMRQPFPMSPAIALVSSSLFVCALLPSILTVSAFVLLLTLASMESEV
ncbi:hypothetical protein BDZ97DRAFT_1702852 [Flammula alnicola]|nr:hypothetical protein BDZ97DRAFT_1702852 [Flammula alnicola]